MLPPLISSSVTKIQTNHYTANLEDRRAIRIPQVPKLLPKINSAKPLIYKDFM